MSLSLFDEATLREPETVPIWKQISLGEILEMCQYGLSVASDGSQTPILGMKNLVAGRVIMEGCPFIDLTAKELSEYRLYPGDILFNRTNSFELVGKTSLFTSLTDAVFASYLIRLRVKPEYGLPEFINYCLNTDYYQTEIKKLATRGVSQCNINPTQLRKRIQILLPPLPEQCRIVEILDEADAARRTTDALIAAKLKLKRAWAERLLTGRVRFPEFAGEAWQTRRLGEFFRDRNARYKGDGSPLVLSCSKIYGIVPQTDLFSRVLASKDLGRYKFVEPGDLVFDPMLLWDASISFSTRTGVVSPAYSTLQFVAAGAEPRFFYYLFDSHALRHVYKTISQGTNTRRKKATASDFLKIVVQVPSFAEQRKIAETLSLMDEEIELLRRQLAALKTQKQGLMQKLLTGEVRVKEFAL